MLPYEKSYGLVAEDSAISQSSIVHTPAPARRKCFAALTVPAAKRRDIINYFFLAAMQEQSEVSAPTPDPHSVTCHSLTMD